MAAVVPWSVLESLIEPHYPKAEPQGGWAPAPDSDRRDVAHLLPAAVVQLSDPGAEEALYDIQSMRAFCNLELGRDPIPDETTILNFRHLLERWGDEGGVRSGGGSSRSAWRVAARQHDRGRDPDRRFAIHQERRGPAGSRNALIEEGQPMVCVTNTGNRPVVLYRRWERTSRSRLVGAGFKPPGAAAFKRRGGERPWKSHPTEGGR